MPPFNDVLGDIGLTMLAISLAGALGLLFGRLSLWGVGLGIGGVLFAGILLGDLLARAGVGLSPEMLEFVREFGLILFVFTIGIQVGPGFFASLRKAGLRFNLAAASIVGLGVAVTLAIHLLFAVPVPALVGLMSGAVTNTPGLGAAVQALADAGATAEQVATPPLGYAVAYPFGVVGILVSMLVIRATTRPSIEAEAAAYDAGRRQTGPLPSLNIVLRNANFDGLPLSSVPGLFDAGVVASRMRKGGALIVPRRETVIALGDMMHLVGPDDRIRALRRILGQSVDEPLTTKGTALRWTRMVVTERRVLGNRLRALALTESHGVTISRILRAGVELPVEADSTLEYGDIVTAVGPAEAPEAVRGILGDQLKRLDEVDFPGLFVGIALGVLLGAIPLALPGLPAPLKLGLAGGPLVAAIVLGRLGHWGPFMWAMPPVANRALREFGIVLFLAVVGLKAGDRFLETLIHGAGLAWIGYGIAITLIPLLTVGLIARLVFGFNYLSLCGVLAGSMTDPPALAFANAQSESPAASVAYASVYPLVMGLRIFVPQVLVLLLL
ncbi:putative transporter [Pararhodobacter marinus]|uniref:putative transporter n=1 Tax=Pararhodobacter marinus TaxID=2184063 RepID=UPI003513ECE6